MEHFNQPIVSILLDLFRESLEEEGYGNIDEQIEDIKKEALKRLCKNMIKMNEAIIVTKEK